MHRACGGPQRASHPPGWYVLCRAQDLRRRPVPVEFGDRRFAVFRPGPDRVAAIADRCAHRATPLAAGTVRDGRLSCPYHGWSWAPDGRLADVPALRHAPGSIPAVSIDAIDCVEQDGYVWGRFGAASTPRPHRFAHFGDAGWTSFTMRTVFDAGVETCLENFLDCPHATEVHRYWFRTPTARAVRCVVRTRSDGAEAEFFDEPRERSAVWWLLAPRSGQMRHVDRFIAPNTSEVDYEFANGWRYIITSTCTPNVAGGSVVHTVISFRVPFVGPLLRLAFEPLARVIIAQDVRMIALQAAGERREPGRFVSTPADLLDGHIRSWRKALAEGTAPPAAGLESHRTVSL